MPSRFGQTMHRHDDYKVQREFERISRQTSSVQDTISFQQTNGSGATGTSPDNKPTLWALTVEKNGNIVARDKDKKIVQVLNFKDYNTFDTAVPIDCRVIWEIQKKIPKKDLLTIENGIQTDIQAVAKLRRGDLNKWLEEVIYDYLQFEDKHHTHYQTLASDIWEVHHRLYKKPSVNLFDENMKSIVGVIKHTTNNDYEVYFKNAIKGYAISN